MNLPRVIVVSGACSKVGKTALAMVLKNLLPNAVVIKIGHGDKKPDLENHFYHHGITFQEIVTRHGSAEWLIIESNGILGEVTPELALFLEGPDAKPSAVLARKKADIISGQRVTPQTIRGLAEKTGLDWPVLRRIAWLTGARPKGANALILAGGSSRRMGKDKAALEVEGTTLLHAACDSLMPLFDQVYVVAGVKPADMPSGAKFIRDKIPRQGPLMAIHSGLGASDQAVNFILAADIPVVDFVLLRELLSWSEAYDIVVPSFRRGFREPLFGVYNKRVAKTTGRLLTGNNRKISELFGILSTKTLSVSRSNWYFNLNTPEDFKHYLETRKSRP